MSPTVQALHMDILGCEIVLAEDPCTVRLANSWSVVNPGGGLTPDILGITQCLAVEWLVPWPQ